MKRSKFNQILDAFDLGCSRLVSGVDDPFSQLYSISRLNKEESKLKNLCVAWVEDLTESTNKLEDIYVAKIEVLEEYAKKDYLTITQWSVADVDGDLSQCGLAGSPTKVKNVENIVFQAKESKRLSASDQDIDSLMKELLANHTIG